MQVYTYVPAGYTGHIVAVEVDIRRGIPGTDIVGLAGSAVREARERVRIAVRRSQMVFPRDRVVVNLSPAGVPKSGAGLDLAIAIAILVCSGQIVTHDRLPVLVLGELRLDGSVRAVMGVLAAICEADRHGIGRYVIPAANRSEAEALGRGLALPVHRLADAVTAIETGVAPSAGFAPAAGRGSGAETRATSTADPTPLGAVGTSTAADFRHFRGASLIVRAMEIAAAGRHNLCLIGPPGSGKTLAARTYPSILAPLSAVESVETTRIHSLAGVHPPDVGLLNAPPFRSPHHSSSTEGMIGGGAVPRPGEISLAHNGVLFLDEALQFRMPVLQSLREPLESRRIMLARATGNYWFPADFQLIVAANPCPCGNLGRPGRHCLCSQAEVARYWRRISGPILDRIDMRVASAPYHAPLLSGDAADSSAEIYQRVRVAVERQRHRYRNQHYDRNSRIPGSHVADLIRADEQAVAALTTATEKLQLSNRAQHSVLRVARTIADLAGCARVDKYHLLEAVQHRRLGETGCGAGGVPELIYRA